MSLAAFVKSKKSRTILVKPKKCFLWRLGLFGSCMQGPMMLMMMMQMPQKHPGAETCAKRCWKKALFQRHSLTRWDFLTDLAFETRSRCRLRSRPFIKICLAHPRRGPGIRLGCWADNFHQFNRETWTKCQCAEICADSAAQALLYMFSSAENSTNSSLMMMILNEKTSMSIIMMFNTHPTRLEQYREICNVCACLCCWDEGCLTPADDTCLPSLI